MHHGMGRLSHESLFLSDSGTPEASRASRRRTDGYSTRQAWPPTLLPRPTRTGLDRRSGVESSPDPEKSRRLIPHSTRHPNPPRSRCRLRPKAPRSRGPLRPDGFCDERRARGRFRLGPNGVRHNCTELLEEFEFKVAADGRIDLH